MAYPYERPDPRQHVEVTMHSIDLVHGSTPIVTGHPDSRPASHNEKRKSMDGDREGEV